jgi:hypothetical protein
MGGRRRFDHLALEVSLAAGRAVPRYALWLALHESGADPERLTRTETVAFCDAGLPGFLAAHGLSLRHSALRRLRNAVRRFDPSVPTPEERLA